MLLLRFLDGIFDKFKGSDINLGLQMKSVGEVMAIGRSFQEALQRPINLWRLKEMV